MRERKWNPDFLVFLSKLGKGSERQKGETLEDPKGMGFPLEKDEQRATRIRGRKNWRAPIFSSAPIL